MPDQECTSGLEEAELGARLPNAHSSEVPGEEFASAKMAILFSERLGTTPEFWMNLQVAYDLEKARANVRLA